MGVREMPKMPKQEFARVSVDVTTYDKLTQLANAANLSRAEYVRRLIWGQFEKVGNKVTSAPTPKPITSLVGISATGFDAVPKAQRDQLRWADGYTEKHGNLIRVEDLTNVARWYTGRATQLGIDIDRRKGIGHLITVFAKIVFLRKAAEGVAGRQLTDADMDTLALATGLFPKQA